MGEPVRVRKSLPLTDRDLAELERLRAPGPQRAVLSELAGIRVETVTEAALLNIIFAAGLRAIREQAEERAYASAATERLASGEAAEIRRTDRRRRPSWADED